jgi:hypothetical protein
MSRLDFSQAGHLPKNRPGGQPGSPDELPRQRNGVTPQMHGRYPDYNVLDEADHWDPVTRQVVFERLEQTPPIRFFTADEAATLGVFCDCVMAQDREPKIPVLNMLDAKLYSGTREGYRYAELPDDDETCASSPAASTPPRASTEPPTSSLLRTTSSGTSSRPSRTGSCMGRCGTRSRQPAPGASSCVMC